MKTQLIIVALLASLSAHAAVALTRTATGRSPAAIAGAIAAFRQDLGGANNGVSTNGGPTFPTGRREINWDAAALPVDMPGDFFNDRSKRGAVFSTPGTGFRVSEDSSDSGTRLFGDINLLYTIQFTTNSPNRLFTPLGSTIVDVHFFVPSTPTTPATVTGFGAVFTGVEVEGLSKIDFFDATDTLLATLPVPVSGNLGLTFAGLSFPGGERVARVRITSGNLPPAAATFEDQTHDVVVMDDFIYSEPQATGAGQVVFSATGLEAANLATSLDAFRAQIGGANNGVSTNGGPSFTSGRREINWDAAALPVEMPADFFNDRSKRGAVFSTPGTGFRVSENSSDSATRLFGDINLLYPVNFNTNSPNRLFTAVGSTVVDVHFFVPSSPTTPATVTAFGAVFTDVEVEGVSQLEFFDEQDALLATVPVPAAQNHSLSFAGLALEDGRRIARVRITSGNVPVGGDTVEDQTHDVVVMDDFIYSEPQAAAAGQVVFSATGLEAANIASSLDAFRAQIGGANNGVSTNAGPSFTSGRREINWDAAALPVEMPADFFNDRSKRGAVFSTPGTGFRVSENSSDSATRLFGDINLLYPVNFNTNSPNRLFTAVGSTVVDVHFFVPSNPSTPATVTAFGAVFTDVEVEGVSQLEFFDEQDALLATVPVPAAQNHSLSFAGLALEDGRRIARVRITSGNVPVGADTVEDQTHDVVVMDDFIYSEPQAAAAGQVVFSATGLEAANLATSLDAFRAQIGGANNGVSTNGGPSFTSGRREINWDAAALPVEMPADFFNDRSKRGAVFSTPGTGFRVSENSSDSATRLFGDINLLYPVNFNTNSPNRLFTALGSTVVDVHFFMPSSPTTPATVTAFGAVFTDVEVEGVSKLEFFGLADELLATVPVPAGKNHGLSFAGLALQDGGQIARVRITSGNVPVGGDTVEDQTHDVVVMDDFIYSEPQPAPVTRFGAGATATELAAVIDLFRQDIGGANNGVSTNGGPSFTSGRREINWDAAALPEVMPADFFNDRSKRGAVFSTPGSGFQVSANTNDGPNRLFGNVNPDYVNQFNTNSPNRLFAAVGSPIVDVHFFVPSSPTTPATVSSFGAVFTDVEVGGTFLEYYGLQDQLLARIAVPAGGNRGLSFAGLRFTDGSPVARVRIVSGTLPLGATNNDAADGDVVAMDDFIYAEPQPAPALFTAAGGAPADIAATLADFRSAIGGANNGVSTNGGAVFADGRREINWDAAGLPEAMPPDFFNSRSLRGAVFSTSGTGFLVSSNSATAPERLFGNVNPEYANQFTTNSPNRIFSAVGSPVLEASFFVPAQPAVPASVRAFGVVFTDVELPGSAKLELLDEDGRSLGIVTAPPTKSGGLSFAGMVLPGEQRAAKVRITSGTVALGPDVNDSATQDVVAMDDFVYSEPQPLAAGTTPPTLSALSISAQGVVTLLLGGDAGATYVVEESSDLTHWTTLSVQGPGPVTDSNAAGVAVRFYRAKQP